MATKDNSKLTLVQIRYMEKRINQTRGNAEDRLQRELNTAREKLPKVEPRTKNEVVAKVLSMHPTLTKANVLHVYERGWGYNGSNTVGIFGVDEDWLNNKEAEKACKVEYDKLIKRFNAAMSDLQTIATEATDAIYLGDASQLNTILSKMDKVKF